MEKLAFLSTKFVAFHKFHKLVCKAPSLFERKYEGGPLFLQGQTLRNVSNMKVSLKIASSEKTGKSNKKKCLLPRYFLPISHPYHFQSGKEVN